MLTANSLLAMATVINPAHSAAESAALQAALEPNQGKFHWKFALVIGIFHLTALAAFFMFRWSSLVVFAVTWIMTQNIGIGLSYHRLLTHRGYAVPDGWNTRWPLWAPWLCRAARFTGLPSIVCTTSLPTNRA